VTIENLLQLAGGISISTGSIELQGFLSADSHDGEQLQADRAANVAMRFQKAPDFSGADYYDLSRHRTYACCFSMENSDYIWSEYANGSTRGKVGVAFDFAKLRATINETMKGGDGLDYRGVRCKQIFSVNYGIVEYMPWTTARENIARMANPIRYTYIKADNCAKERELRISVSALGMGRYVLADGVEIEFPRVFSSALIFNEPRRIARSQRFFPGPVVI